MHIDFDIIGIGAVDKGCNNNNNNNYTASIDCFSFITTSDDLSNFSYQRLQRRKRRRERNKLASQSYFKSNPTQKGLRKRMIDI